MQRDIRTFSLLAPEGAKPCAALQDTTIHDLSLHYLCSHIAHNAAEETILLGFLREMPTDAETIAYRQAVYQDLRKDPQFCEKLMEIFDAMQFGSIDILRPRVPSFPSRSLPQKNWQPEISGSMPSRPV